MNKNENGLMRIRMDERMRMNELMNEKENE